jgi:hypothetical protein
LFNEQLGPSAGRIRAAHVGASAKQRDGLVRATRV